MQFPKLFLLTFFLTVLLFLSGCSPVDTSSCDDTIPSTEAEVMSKINCYRRLAAETLNPDVCDKIQQLAAEATPPQAYPPTFFSQFSDACKLEIIYQSNTSSSRVCKSLATPKIQGMCYSYVAVQSEDPFLCLKGAKLTDQELQGGSSFLECFVTLAVKKNDMRFCNSILNYIDAEYFQLAYPDMPDSSLKDFEAFLPFDCFLRYAYQSKDPAACALTHENRKDYCYQWMANALEDESHCASISKETPANPQLGTTFGYRTLHDTCFQDIAVRKKNKQICDNIPPTDPTDLKNATDVLSILFPQGQIHIPDPLSVRKECYTKVDQALGIAPDPSLLFGINISEYTSL